MEFIGQFPARLDAKNRVFLPAQFRHELQESGSQTLVVRKDYFENCLVLYTGQAWQTEVEKVRGRLNRFDMGQQMLYRKMVSEAQTLQIDASGRILLPKMLLDKVGVVQDALFVGMQNTIEIWAQENAVSADGDNFMSDTEFVAGLQTFMSENGE